jgi:signal transduction histidine kinase/DNA-binding NarL/FixJ family response regulator
VLIAFAALHGVCFAHRPQVFRVDGFPEQARQIWSVAQISDGWVAGSAEGLAVTGQMGWSILRPPSLTEVHVLLPFGSGAISAGDGVCHYYENGIWRDLHLDDEFYAGASLGGSAIISGRHGIYHIGADLKGTRILTPSNVGNYYVHVLGGKMYVFGLTDGVFVWSETEAKLVPVHDRFGWGNGRQIATIQELGPDTFLIASNDGILLEGTSGERRILAEESKELVREALIGAFQFGDTVVVATFYGGLHGYSLSRTHAPWQIGPEVFGGNFFCAKLLNDSLLIGGSGGLYVLPDPQRFRFSTLPAGDILFARPFSRGTLIGLRSGEVVDENGAKIPWTGIPLSLAEVSNGEFIEGRWGRIVTTHGEIELMGRDVYALALVDPTRVVALQPEGASIVDLKSNAVARLELNATANSVACYSEGILIGTSAGAAWFSREGRRVASFGSGITRVHGLHNGCLALDAARVLYDQTGKRLGTLPFSELLSVVEWQGMICALARMPDGVAWLGELKDGREWMPFDLPLPVSPTHLSVSGDDLLVIGPGMVMAVSAAVPLAAPRVSVALRNQAGATLADGATLPTAENTVDLIVPPGRLSPWRNPNVTFRTGNGPAVDLALGTRVPIPRLEWGRTEIELELSWAGLDAQSTLSVVRLRPWWASWPGILLYSLAAGGAVYATIRWRTARLERRASELEKVVEQRTAQLRKAQQAREEFFSMMSHEIRNPLNGVVGLCEIVENAPANAVAPRERMLLKTLRGCADQLRSILDDILDFSRIDRGEIQLNEEMFELVDAVEGAARAVDAGLTRCTVELPAGPIWVRGDCGKLRQVVTNLVSNALKYGIPSAARVFAEVAPGTAGTFHASIRVLNTGPTIPAEEISRIFEGYVRGEDARRRKISGTGLGLAVSRRIAMAMGGSLAATSHEGLTEFRLELVLPEGTPPVEEVFEAAPREKTSRALGIEDEPYNRLVLGSILGQLGYEVDWAADGAAALAYVRSGTYDLILTDFMLPDTNGVELAREMLTLLAEPKPPIIAVTAYSTPEKMAQAREAGISGFVTKPVSKHKIQAAIMGSAGGFPARRSLDLRTVDCDFSMILRLKNGRQQLAEYADDLPRVWARVMALLQSVDDSAEECARAVHSFRSRILAVHAMTISEQLSLLEDAARAKRREDIDRLVSVIEPLLDELAEAARGRALASAGLPLS